MSEGGRGSRRGKSIAPFMVMEILERSQELERAGRSIVHLEVGEPDFCTPKVVLEAGIHALRAGHTHYTHSLGLLELREAIAAWQFETYGVEISPEQVIVTTGSSSALLLALAALIDVGEEVLIPDPGYPCYPKFVQALGGKPVGVRVEERAGFEYSLEVLEQAMGPDTRAVVVNSPSNPTGTLYSVEGLQALAEHLAGRATLISDEIYHGLVYEGRAHSVLEYEPDAVVINGFSKLFAMTGWRLGYAVLPEPLVRSVQRLQQNLFISAPDFAQWAAIAALREAGPEVERMRREYDRRRRFVLERAAELGLPVAGRPAGAFYVLLNVSSFSEDVYGFAFDLLEKSGVGVAPGVDFGRYGEGYVRISYATSMEKLDEGLTRIGKYLETHGFKEEKRQKEESGSSPPQPGE